jgi:hypothetical protein
MRAMKQIFRKLSKLGKIRSREQAETLFHSSMCASEEITGFF